MNFVYCFLLLRASFEAYAYPSKHQTNGNYLREVDRRDKVLKPIATHNNTTNNAVGQQTLEEDDDESKTESATVMKLTRSKHQSSKRSKLHDRISILEMIKEILGTVMRTNDACYYTSRNPYRDSSYMEGPRLIPVPIVIYQSVVNNHKSNAQSNEQTSGTNNTELFRNSLISRSSVGNKLADSNRKPGVEFNTALDTGRTKTKLSDGRQRRWNGGKSSDVKYLQRVPTITLEDLIKDDEYIINYEDDDIE